MSSNTTKKGPEISQISHDLEGKKFNRLTVIYEFRHNGRKWVRCKCDCGTESAHQLRFVISGHTKSCGFLFRESLGKARITHGMSRSDGGHTKIYRTWSGIKSRCFNQNHVFYEYYGGRGITMCEIWKNSFESFFGDVGLPPSEAHSIDRIDNNGNYEKSNCRWATPSEQAKNKRPYKTKAKENKSR